MIRTDSNGVCASTPTSRFRRDLTEVVVPGEGPLTATLMLIGERPGKWEAIEGRPFVGPAGRDLNGYLEEAGLERFELYITNLVKTFADYAKPTPEEIERWLPTLHREIAQVNPRTIGLLGQYAVKGVMGAWWESPNLAERHGRPWRLPESGVVIVPCYHPASGLYENKETYIPRLKHDFKMLKHCHYGEWSQVIDYDDRSPVMVKVVGTEIAAGSFAPQPKLF